MQIRRKAAGLVAAVGLAGGTLLAAAPVQASGTAQTPGSAERAGGDRVQTAPPAPAGARADAGVMATSPRISPAAEQIRYVTSNTDYACSYGRLCTRVWDPVVGKWKIFDLYVCRTYSLSYWNGTGGYVNNQTTGTKAYYYNSSGGVIKTSTALDTSNSYNWTPVWKIKNC
ncbi:hypothetical protein LIX60_27365 [Streptomyces sp. S07_1.15]|uniref:hypothetical protein n=1 Tax=Streptomyces sp. S07_1.15 TaxID=2873925 RepID=UPI001D151CB8|nr:hypothetical protein [Streptomyces sp. S07_1.15]MCC3655122.1 hypothetical protein [Streptomyces sp. S07_1.15]